MYLYLKILKSFILYIFLFSTILNAHSIFNKEEKKWIKENPTITIAMLDDFKPFSFIYQNHHQGFTVDLLDRISKITNLKFQIKTSSWNKALQDFKTQKVSMISGISYNKKREDFTLFTQAYYEMPTYLFGHQNSTYDGSFTDKKLAITTNVFYKEQLKSLGIDIVEYDTSRKKALAVFNGEADFFLDSFLTGQETIKNQSLRTLKVIDEFPLIQKEDLRFGINPDKKTLHSIIEKAYKTISTSDLINLSNKWMINTQEYKTKKVDFTKKEKTYLKNKKSITMCIDPDWMPFETFDQDGKHIGISASYFKLFQKNIDIPIDVIPTTTWSQSIEKAKNRECDIMSLVMKTPKREEYLNFTTPYMSIPLVVATLPNVTFISDVSMLNEKKIGIVKGYAFNELIRNKYPNIHIVDVKNIKDGLQRVVNGELFGFVGTLASIGYQFQNAFVGELKITGKFEDKWELGIGVRDDDAMLLSIFEKIVLSITENDNQNILNKHIAITYEKGTDYSLAWKILALTLFLLLVMLYFQKKLKTKVDEKTLELKKLNDSLERRIKEEVEKNLNVQEKLFKSEKLASMGEMIGNIAHQWRQPLSVISTGASGMQIQKEYGILSDEKFNEACNSINRNAQYLSKTIDDFRDFIKGDRVKKVFCLEEDIKSFISLVEGSIKSNDIIVVLDLEKDISIDGYQNELTQCLINIFNNAKDALKDTKQDKKYLFISTKKNKNSVTIELKDNAKGIPKDILPKIFDPYFTTKTKSQGTGLGLHMTYSLIVEGMKGTIEAKNIEYIYDDKSYKGAVFKIEIPLL
ncbi:MAG: transporter substrate-binding domain-containing protein [Campylobacterota bacterium]|nr:transporter substrate-binding domain-containing protein [Campylobacterota bacterium]